MEDLEPSIPRTPAQAVLRMVSMLMGGIGLLVLVGGIAVLVGNVMGLLPGGDIWAVGHLWRHDPRGRRGCSSSRRRSGLAASNNSARVGPYRFLCYLVGLAVLVAIVWGWGMGTFILFNPIVLTTTIVYVLICSRLADKVKEEHDKGVARRDVPALAPPARAAPALRADHPEGRGDGRGGRGAGRRARRVRGGGARRHLGRPGDGLRHALRAARRRRALLGRERARGRALASGGPTGRRRSRRFWWLRRSRCALRPRAGRRARASSAGSSASRLTLVLRPACSWPCASTWPSA